MSDKIIVRRANVLLEVPQDQQDEYLAKGFDVLDSKGKVVVEATMTNDISTLRKKLAEAQEKIKVLAAENKRLNEELDSLAQEDQVDFEDVEAKKTSTKKKSK